MKRYIRWIPAILWMLLIFWLSSRTGSELGSLFPIVERFAPWLDGFNFGHFIAYYVLALLVWWGFGSHRLSVKVIVVLLCLVYGATDEYHQTFVEGRYPDIYDLRNDGIGAALAMLTISIPFVRRRLS